MIESETVMVVDGGGRGAALVDKYAQSTNVKRIIAVPGNDMMKIGLNKQVDISPGVETTDTLAIEDICKRERVTLADVQLDAALENGLVDALQKIGVPTVGPKKDAARIEWDKAYARELGRKKGLPQPDFKICSSVEEGEIYLRNSPEQKWFVKASGLARGKGALPAESNEEAWEKIKELREKFPDAARVFLLEKWLGGEEGFSQEFSTFVVTDGQSYKILGNARDYKRAEDGNKGENTGSMGSVSPVPFLTEEVMGKVRSRILDKTIKGLTDQGQKYKGILYLGGMAIKEKGEINPYVIEFNARWGDPEAQILLPGILNDLFEVGMAVVQGIVVDLNLKFDGKSRVVVTGAARGYPGDYSNVSGKEIIGLDNAREVEGVKIIGAGVKVVDGKYYASGGRLFYIVGEGKSVVEARGRAYEAMEKVSVEGNNLHFRTDIGWRDVQRLRK